MYIKVFESRQSSRWYILKHNISMRGLDHGVMTIENNKHEIIKISEDDLFYLVHALFRMKQNEKVKANDQERRCEAR